jgi:uncharacterized cupredoxin-like copper-binding protein
MNITLHAAAFAAMTTICVISPQSNPACAHGTEAHAGAAHGATATDGTPGNPADAKRTIRIEARDSDFNVKQIQVRAGETVRFVIANVSSEPHEFAIASPAEQEEHRAMMKQMPNMVHEDPNVVSVFPGETKELVWKFGKDTNVTFACNIPGHAEHGMEGAFRVMK